MANTEKITFADLVKNCNLADCKLDFTGIDTYKNVDNNGDISIDKRYYRQFIENNVDELFNTDDASTLRQVFNLLNGKTFTSKYTVKSIAVYLAKTLGVTVGEKSAGNSYTQAIKDNGEALHVVFKSGRNGAGDSAKAELVNAKKQHDAEKQEMANGFTATLVSLAVKQLQRGDNATDLKASGYADDIISKAVLQYAESQETELLKLCKKHNITVAKLKELLKLK